MEGEPGTVVWASGRVLTQAQRERKRERNRLSRKRAADRAKNRMANLEESLLSLQTSLAETGHSRQQPFFYQDIQSPTSVPFGCSKSELPPAATINNPDNVLEQTHTGFQNTSASPCLQIARFATTNQVIPAPSPANLGGGNDTWPPTYGVSPQTEQDEFFNTLLSSALHGQVGRICKNEQIYEDLLIRATLGEGWDSLSNRMGPNSCPLLAVLRHLDEAALQECRPIDRLALLHAVHLMYLVWSAQTSLCRGREVNGFSSL
ncbi:hypothetical protein BJX70DRAFT_225197 [Aspergillus crustosus]